MSRGNSLYPACLKIIILLLGLPLLSCEYLDKFLSSSGSTTYFILENTKNKMHKIEIGDNTAVIQSGITHYGNIFVRIDLDISDQITYFPYNLQIYIDNKSMQIEHLIHTCKAAPDSVYKISSSEEWFDYWLPRADTKKIRDSREIQIYGKDIFLYNGNYTSIDTISFFYPYNTRGKFNRPEKQ